MDLLPADAATLILSSGWPLFLSPLARVELSVDMNDAGFVIIDLDCFSALMVSLRRRSAGDSL